MISKIGFVCLLAFFSLQIAASIQEDEDQVPIEPKHWLEVLLRLLGELLSGLSEISKYTISVAGISDESCNFWDLSLCVVLQTRFGFFGGDIPKHPAHNNVMNVPKPPDANNCRVPDNYTFPDVYLAGMADYLNTTFWAIQNLTKDGHVPEQLKHLLGGYWDLQKSMEKIIPSHRNVCITPLKISTGIGKVTVKTGSGDHLADILTK
ncbi:unnamed protein product [Trichobilharzia szidati]|nr:unnamed protein product [Trichobilharzia szidati]